MVSYKIYHLNCVSCIALLLHWCIVLCYSLTKALTFEINFKNENPNLLLHDVVIGKILMFHL